MHIYTCVKKRSFNTARSMSWKSDWQCRKNYLMTGTKCLTHCIPCLLPHPGGVCTEIGKNISSTPFFFKKHLCTRCDQIIDGCTMIMPHVHTKAGIFCTLVKTRILFGWTLASSTFGYILLYVADKIIHFLKGLSTLRKDFVILQLYWCLFSSIKHYSWNMV